jgi:hypothetical protein
MKTIYLGGVQPGSFRVGYSLGQALSKADRDHYLTALNRALEENDEIDAWIKANASAKLKPSTADAANPDIVVSPYFSKWANFLPTLPDMVTFRDRLKNEDPTSWTSITDPEHKTFGWVNVVDEVYSSFKGDPKNLTAGKWMNGVRQPDPSTPTNTVAMPAATITILGMDPQTAWIVGGVGLLGLGVAAWAMFRGK